MKKWLKYLKITAITLGIFIVIALITSSLIVYFYKDNLVKYALTQLQKQINTDIKMDKVDLSIISTFPNASLVFTNISADEATPQKTKKKLFKFESVYLTFNVWDLFEGNYTIKKIIVEDGSCSLKVFADGNDNYHFWKIKSDSNKSDGKFSFKLNKVTLKNIEIQYTNEIKDAIIIASINKMTLKGKFNEKQFELAINSNTDVKEFRFEKINYFKQKDVAFDVVLDVTNNELFNVKRGKIELADQKFSISGFVNNGAESIKTDITIKGEDLKLKKTLSLVPEKFQSYWKDYDLDGELYFDATMKGQINKVETPKITASFGVKNGKLKKSGSKLELTNIGFTAKYSNAINNLIMNLGANSLKGNIEIIDFTSPHIKANSTASVDLLKWNEIFPTESVESIEGNAELAIQFETQLQEMSKFTPSDFIQSNTTGTLKLAKTKIKLKKDNHLLSNISADIIFNNNDITAKALNFNIGSSNFSIAGEIKNFLSYIFLEKQKLYIQADVNSNMLNLDELLTTSGTKNNGSDYKLGISNSFDFDITLGIKKLQFRKFNASELKTKLILRNMKCVAQDMSMNTMDGIFNCTGILDATNSNNISIICDGAIKKMNIQKIFYQLENLGQSSLKSENIKGIASANIQFSALLNSGLSINPTSIKSNIDLLIEKGELINFESLKKLSKFVSIDELQNVKFSTIKNTLQVQNRVLTIPRMEICSNAMNLTLSGSHTFDNLINYSLELLLSDVLGKKAKKAKKENEDFGVETDDGLGKTKLFIKITGTTDNPKYAYDKQGLKQKIKTDVKNEKQNLKQILNQEFGWFKKDTAVIKKNTVNPNNTTPSKITTEKKKKKKDDEIEDKIKVEW